MLQLHALFAEKLPLWNLLTSLVFAAEVETYIATIHDVFVFSISSVVSIE